jgi:hypothetical protein
MSTTQRQRHAPLVRALGMAALFSVGPFLSALSSCAASGSSPAAPLPTADERALRELIAELYAAFSYDPGAEPDWDAQRALFLPGACLVAPIAPGRSPRASDATGFLQDFQEALSSSRIGQCGFHERVTHARIDVCGDIANAFVVFDGFVPPAGVATAGGASAAAALATRGLDSLLLVRDGRRWLVAAFATQYASEQRPLPAAYTLPELRWLTQPGG